MNDLDNILAAAGISLTTTVDNSQSYTTDKPTQKEEPEEKKEQEEPKDEEPQEEPTTATLNSSDFDSILEENGFSVDEDESEEEEEDDEEDDDEEERDLDAEEDEDFERLVESGVIQPISNITESQEAITVDQNPPPIVDTETSEVPQDEDDDKKIPLNSPTLLIDTSTSRFSGTEWYNEIQKANVILAGIGGIGSWTAFQLARMSLNKLVLYDNDTVESANMSGQLFGYDDIGRAKVDAISRMLTNYTSTSNIYSIRQMFTNTTEAGPIMICGFDSMNARSTFFLSWRDYVQKLPEDERKNCLFIDGRLSIDTLQVFCITGDDKYNMGRYSKEFLFSDSMADHTVCSMKQTTYLACMIGSMIVNLFTNFIANTLNPIIPYDLPFFTEYDSQNMIFKTEK